MPNDEHDNLMDLHDFDDEHDDLFFDDEDEDDYDYDDVFERIFE